MGRISGPPNAAVQRVRMGRLEAALLDYTDLELERLQPLLDELGEKLRGGPRPGARPTLVQDPLL